MPLQPRQQPANPKQVNRAVVQQTPSPTRADAAAAASLAPSAALDASPVPPRFQPQTRFNKRRAPAAVPSSIRNETDPAKRAQLLRMHRVATARVLVSTLRRRQRMLSRTLNNSKKDGKSMERINKLRSQMNELGKSLREANRELERAQAAVDESSPARQ